MASPANPEASEVRRRGRQRLIGAIALVAVLVVFVPMVLDKEPRQQRGGPELAIPSKTNAPPLPAPPKAAPVTPAPGKVIPGQAPSGAQSASVTPAPGKVTPGQAPSGAQSSEGRQPKTDPKAAESKVLESKPPAAPPKPPASVVAAAAPSPAPAATAKAQPEAAPKLEGFAVQVGAFRPDVLALDIRMPRLDGFEVCRRLKARRDTAGIRILAMTAYSEGEVKRKIIACGAEDFIEKPFSITDFRARILALLGKTASR